MPRMVVAGRRFGMCFSTNYFRRRELFVDLILCFVSFRPFPNAKSCCGVPQRRVEGMDPSPYNSKYHRREQSLCFLFFPFFLVAANRT